MSEGDVGWNLVMPFVVCESSGGPYDDQAFVAGFHLGYIDCLLESAAREQLTGPYDTYVKPECLPQLDLIAMRRGFVIAEGNDPDSDGWTHVVFTRAQEVPGG